MSRDALIAKKVFTHTRDHRCVHVQTHKEMHLSGTCSRTALFGYVNKQNIKTLGDAFKWGWLAAKYAIFLKHCV